MDSLAIESPSSYLELESLQTKIDSFHNALIDRLKKTQSYFEDGEASCSGDWTADYRPSKNPLKNPYILEMIAHHLPNHEMRQCMLVCKVWAKEMNRCMNKRKKLFLGPKNFDQAEAVLKSHKDGNLVNVSTICLFQISYSNSLFQRLMRAFGNTLAVLKLEECNISSAELFQILHNHAPNLEVLCLSQRVPDREVVEVVPDAPPQLFVHPAIRLSTFTQMKQLNSEFKLPKLKKLQWYEREGQVGLEEIIECCENLVDLDFENCPHPVASNFQNLKWDTLRNLCISPTDELRTSYFDVLTRLQLKVSKVTLYQLYPGSRKRMEDLKNFLKSISSTLQDLYLYQHTTADRAIYEPNYASPFPVKLPKIVNLIIEPGFMTSFKMFKLMPALKRFKCKFRKSEDWAKVLLKELPPPQNHFIDLSIGSVDMSVLNKMSTIFPKLTNLELNTSKVNDEAFRIIIKGFPNLKHIKILKCRDTAELLITDSAITGFSVEDCARLRDDPNLDDLDPAPLRKFPYIGNLPSLHGLELETMCSSLSDLSTVFGFCTLNELRFLSIPNSQITGRSLDKIVVKLPYLLILGVQQCSKVSKAEIIALQEKRPELMINVFSILETIGDMFDDEP